MTPATDQIERLRSDSAIVAARARDLRRQAAGLAPLRLWKDEP